MQDNKRIIAARITDKRGKMTAYYCKVLDEIIFELTDIALSFYSIGEIDMYIRTVQARNILMSEVDRWAHKNPAYAYPDRGQELLAE